MIAIHGKVRKLAMAGSYEHERPRSALVLDGGEPWEGEVEGQLSFAEWYEREYDRPVPDVKL